jgi:CAAX prenyl protease-like protein
MEKAYILPFVIYLGGTTLASQWPQFYPITYSLTVLLTGVFTWRSLKNSAVFVPHWKVLSAVVVGVLGIALWIGLCHLNLESKLIEFLPKWLHPSPRAAFNPFEEITQPALAFGFIFVRLMGLALLVPVIEEIFWRGFLARWIVSDDWEKVPIGTFNRTSFIAVTFFFTVAHPEWFAAFTYCVLLNTYLMWKKDLWLCVVAHAVSNLILGIYVMTTGAYELW